MKICPESAKLTALREGWLEEDEAARLRGHIAECRACRLVLDGLDEVVELLSGQVDPVEPPPGGYEELMKAALLMRDRTAPLPVRSTPRWMWSMVTAAAVIMMAVTAFSIIDSGSPPPQSVAEMSEEDDIPDFFIEEHALATETLPFSDGASAVVMVRRGRR